MQLPRSRQAGACDCHVNMVHPRATGLRQNILSRHSESSKASRFGTTREFVEGCPNQAGIPWKSSRAIALIGPVLRFACDLVALSKGEVLQRIQSPWRIVTWILTAYLGLSGFWSNRHLTM